MNVSKTARGERPTPDPTRFDSPRSVVRSTGLGEEEKERVLREWLADELALVVAEGEGMLGAPPRVEDVAEALEQVHEEHG